MEITWGNKTLTKPKGIILNKSNYINFKNESEKAENQLSYIIRGAAFEVFNQLGPGLLESVYQAALVYELKIHHLNVKTEVELPVKYKDIYLDQGFRLDILVNDLVVIEIKSVESLSKVHYKQLQTYLKLSGKKLGLLINFNQSSMNDAIHRIVYGL